MTYLLTFVDDNGQTVREIGVIAGDHWEACTRGLSLLATLVKDATDFQVSEIQ